MKKLIVLFIILAVQAQAKEINMAELTDRQPIDGNLPTLLVFPEPANLALASPQIELKPMAEGDTSNIWKATPSSVMGDLDLEFVLASGKHLILKVRLSADIKDHVLAIKDNPNLGSVEATRNKIVPLARQTFLRVVRNSPPLLKADEEVPESIKSLAKEWKIYKTEQLLIHIGSTTTAKKEEIEALKEASLIMIGFYDNSIVVIFRRKA